MTDQAQALQSLVEAVQIGLYAVAAMGIVTCLIVVIMERVKRWAERRNDVRAHWTCVPTLKKVIKELEGALTVSRLANESLREKITTLEAERNDAVKAARRK